MELILYSSGRSPEVIVVRNRSARETSSACFKESLSDSQVRLVDPSGL